MTTPKSCKYKIAFTGTNCSGKTTMAMAVAARLKGRHVLAELVSSQDRKITWKDEHFPVDPRAHFGMMANLVNAEVQAELKGDAEVVITDRSLLDLYSIALYDHPTSEMVAAMRDYVVAWAATYAKIYYLAPLPYQNDNKRPSDDFRLATHGRLVQLLDELNLPNVVRIDRSEVFSDIKHLLNLKGNPSYLEAEKWQKIANYIGKTLMVKVPECEITSDLDVWILSDPYEGYTADEEKLKAAVYQYFGQVPVHVLCAPASAKKPPFTAHIYQPRSE